MWTGQNEEINGNSGNIHRNKDQDSSSFGVNEEEEVYNRTAEVS